MRTLLFTLLCLSSSMAFAGHPASDRVLDFFMDVEKLHAPGGATPAAVCRVIQSSFEHQKIAVRLLGNYINSPDKAGVNEFRASSDTFMASKAMPELKKLTGESGSYAVNPNATPKDGGFFAVGATVKAKGKTYRLNFILTSAYKISDVEYLGISAMAYLGSDFRKDLDKLKKTTNTPVSAYIAQMKADADYVNCN